LVDYVVLFRCSDFTNQIRLNFLETTDISITGHVTVIWSPVAKIASGFCSVCCENSRYGEVVLMHLLWQTTVV